MKLAKRAASLLLAGLMLAALGVGAVAWQQGYRVYAVQSGSMSPSYPTGTMIVDVPPGTDGSTPSVITPGSVVTFKVGDGLVTHRVVEASGAGLTTKGDANETPDAWTVPADVVVGQVVASVPRMGYLLVFFKQPAGVVAVVTGLVSMMLLWHLFFDEPSDETAPVVVPV